MSRTLKTVCKYGHDLTDPVNGHQMKGGKRYCYPCQRRRNREFLKAHPGYGTRPVPRRRAWIAANGPILEGMKVLVTCGDLSCLDAAHMELKTNSEAAAIAGRAQTPKPYKTHCIHGHALTPDNVLVNMRGDGRARRECRICFRRRVNATNARRRARERAV